MQCPASEESSRARVSHRYNKLFGFWGTDARKAFAESGERQEQPMRRSLAGYASRARTSGCAYRRLRIPTHENEGPSCCRGIEACLPPQPTPRRIHTRPLSLVHLLLKSPVPLATRSWPSRSIYLLTRIPVYYHLDRSARTRNPPTTRRQRASSTPPALLPPRKGTARDKIDS
jgi:hypothetical protein